MSVKSVADPLTVFCHLLKTILIPSISCVTQFSGWPAEGTIKQNTVLCVQWYGCVSKLRGSANNNFLNAGVQKIFRQPTVSLRREEVHVSISQTSYCQLFFSLLNVALKSQNLLTLDLFSALGFVHSSWVVPQKQKYLLFSILEEEGRGVTACMCVRSVMTPTPHTKPVASSSAYGSQEGVGGGRDVGDFTSSHGVR